MNWTVVQRILGLLLMMFSLTMLPPIAFSIRSATASASDEATRDAFQRAYPLDAGLVAALEAEIAKLQ